ncbi:MAG: hypothetical protein LBF59_05895, partial [Prevotellaceae bacterium]|nr:hypothetical protein [Prevotellaceae bacterium]
KAFENIEFYNLPAIDGIRVSGIMKNGKTQSVKFEKNGKVIKEIAGKNNVSVKLKKEKLIDR